MRLLGIAAPLWLSLTTMVTGLPQGSQGSHNATYDPSKLAYYPAPFPNGLNTAVLVIPGGGYSHVSLDREGTNSTLYLNQNGYDAWVLNYTVAETLGAPVPLYPKPMEEALHAVRYIRSQKEVKVDKLGIWGYSAGGHLAAITVTDPRAQGSLDFGILTYPVISMDPAITHEGSKVNLIGENPSPELVRAMSAETRVTNSTPPIFVYSSANDATVPVENTLRFVGALTRESVPWQALVIPDGEHGIALALDDPQRNWSSELTRFLTYSV